MLRWYLHSLRSCIYVYLLLSVTIVSMHLTSMHLTNVIKDALSKTCCSKTLFGGIFPGLCYTLWIRKSGRNFHRTRTYSRIDDPIRWRTVDANLELAHLVRKTAWPPWTAPAYKNTQTNMNASNYNTLAIGGILLCFFRSMVSIRA